jgi:hypothetical protein
MSEKEHGTQAGIPLQYLMETYYLILVDGFRGGDN